MHLPVTHLLPVENRDSGAIGNIMEQKRQEEIALTLEGFLVDGERFVVDCHEDGVDVQPIEESRLKPLADEKPELYGHLLAVSEILSDAGSNFVLFPMMTVAVVCLIIHMQWVDTLIGIDIEELRNFWVYAVALGVCFFVCGQVALWVEGLAYRRYRDELIRHIREEGLSRWYLLARISADEDLSNVVDKLKTDWREWSSSGFDR